ncbi:hypothetical protein [Nubsella zeaxanthinifaciens]|uniref:hypothetical protein n=1 Tax=Nubsella zeaxanthinifaciens TaxID=392412 RepID=UPI0018E5A0B3|nr:hypothetical protein [Nubsella zeaxanthinifaciens]
MKKALHILLLTFYLLSSTDMQELTKLPVLFQHYFEHKNLDNSITFFGYLEHHYNDLGHGNDGDAARDKQLPFKTHEFCNVSFISPALPPTTGLTIQKFSQVIAKQQMPIVNEPSSYSAYAGKIWQPPKIITVS